MTNQIALAVDKLERAIEQAQRDVDQDDFLWGDPEGDNYAMGQDSEEAEESGRMVGYLQGLQEALKIISQ